MGRTLPGEYGLVEIVVRKGDGSPWHVHPEEDEWFYVLDGEYTVYVGDDRLTLTAGSFAFGPHGVPHTFIAETDGATVLVGFQPFQFEGFIREVGEPAAERVLPPPPESPPDMERLLPIAEETGSTSSGRQVHLRGDKPRRLEQQGEAPPKLGALRVSLGSLLRACRSSLRKTDRVLLVDLDVGVLSHAGSSGAEVLPQGVGSPSSHTQVATDPSLGGRNCRN